MTESIDKISRIDSIVRFDRAEIDYLLKCWDDRDLKVRYHAYCKLNSLDRASQILSTSEIDLVSQGVLLESGDVVWSVYQSGLDHDDSDYSINYFPDETGENIYGQPADLYIWDRAVPPKLISTHVDRESAESVATKTIKDILIKGLYLQRDSERTNLFYSLNYAGLEYIGDRYPSDRGMYANI